MKKQSKLEQNNEFVNNEIDRGRSSCLLSELPSRRLARQTNGVLSVDGERVVFTSSSKNTLTESDLPDWV